ncbi:unnamed protein product, partial [Polarella glacialis]
EQSFAPPPGAESASPNRQKVEQIRVSNRELSSRLDELLVGRISEDQSYARYKEKAKIKDAQIQALEAALARQREKVNRTEGALTADGHRLQTELAVLKTELHH